MNRDSRNC